MDETNREMRMRDYFGVGESSCCDVESGMNPLVQNSKVANCSSVPGTCEERTVATDAYSATDDSSEIRVGVSVEGENRGIIWAPYTIVELKEGCVSGESSSTEEQNTIGSAEQIRETASGDLNPQVPGLQPLASGSEGDGHFHAEAFNAFQYWRFPIAELELDFSLAETGKPTAVQVKTDVTGETVGQTFASELNVNMDIDVSNFEILSYIYFLWLDVYLSPNFFVEVRLQEWCSSTCLPTACCYMLLHSWLAMAN
jgi:hypothetical protein